jgi:hypothetical protein
MTNHPAAQHLASQHASANSASFCDLTILLLQAAETPAAAAADSRAPSPVPDGPGALLVSFFYMLNQCSSRQQLCMTVYAAALMV